MTRFPCFGEGKQVAKATLATSVLFGLALNSGAAFAFTAYLDSTSVQRYNGATIQANNGVDVIGSGVFDSADPTITFDPNSTVATVTIKTNWDFSLGTQVNGRVITADVFFDNTSVGNANTFEYALETSGYKALPGGGYASNGLTAGNVYDLGTFQTSYDVFSGTGLGYGGEWGTGFGAGNFVSNGKAPTNLLTGVFNQSATGFTTTAGALLQFKVDFSKFGAAGETINILWGTATCANDTVMSSVVIPASVPIPAAVWLFGSALAGMGTIGGWRRRAESGAA